MSIEGHIRENRARLQALREFVASVREWECATPEEEEHQRAILVLAEGSERSISMGESNPFDYRPFAIRPDTAISLLELVGAPTVEKEQT